jgi:hypothetical protein
LPDGLWGDTSEMGAGFLGKRPTESEKNLLAEPEKTYRDCKKILEKTRSKSIKVQ